MIWLSFGLKHKRTKRNMGLLHIIISLLLNDEVHSVFEVINTPNQLSWESALHRCNSSKNNWTIAVPAVDLTSMTVKDEIALEGEAWVGYFQSYEHFLFIVCVPLRVIESFVFSQYSIRRNNNGPGMCYSLCGLQGYIGLQDGICYCIDTRNLFDQNTIPFNSSCTKPLQCGNGMLCGDQGYGKISVYKKVSLSSSSIKGVGIGCLLVSKDNYYEMSVVNCDNSYRHLCEAQTGQTLYLEVSEVKQQWVHSITNCGKTFKRPTTFLGDRTSYIFPNVSGSWWATVVRDLVIRNCSKTCTIIGTPLYEGYLKNSSYEIKLEFVHAANMSKKTSVACMSGRKMERKTENSTPDSHGTPLVSRTSESARTVDVSVLLGVVSSFMSLLVISILLNIYFIRKRIQMENTTELPYRNPMAHEVERERNDTISGALNTEIRSIPDTYCSISTSTASYTSPRQDQDGYITPIIDGAIARYDYVE